MLHIGILAHSADGAALCFLEMVRAASARLGAHEHPEITLSILPMGPALESYARNDLAAVRAHLSRTADRLAAAGADFFVCPDNTAHIALELTGAPLPLPGLHIAAIVAARAKADGRRSIALLGTKWTMEGPVYPAAFARLGLTMRTPPPDDRKVVDDVIFDELCQGVVSDRSRAEYVRRTWLWQYRTGACRRASTSGTSAGALCASTHDGSQAPCVRVAAPSTRRAASRGRPRRGSAASR